MYPVHAPVHRRRLDGGYVNNKTVPPRPGQHPGQADGQQPVFPVRQAPPSQRSPDQKQEVDCEGQECPQYMHLFTAAAWTGELSECNEGDLEWVPKQHPGQGNGQQPVLPVRQAPSPQGGAGQKQEEPRQQRKIVRAVKSRRRRLRVRREPRGVRRSGDPGGDRPDADGLPLSWHHHL